jgi:galactoside O-acetyltransferase
VGESVLISKACNIVGLENIEIGNHVRIDAFTSIIAVRGWARLGSYIHITTGCLLGASGGIEFGDFTGLSQGSMLLSSSDDYSGEWMLSYMVPTEFTNPTVAPIRVNRHAVIGANCVVFPGCDIGEGSVVGAGSVVTRPLAPWGVYAGTPAKVIKPRMKNVLMHERRLLAGLAPKAARRAS